MRYINTNNSHVTFVEVNDLTSEIISVKGFAYAALHYLLKNNKVSFYLNDQENPYSTEVWSINLPFTMDGEEVNADNLEEKLGGVMADQWAQKIEQLQEDLAAEEVRAVSAETRIEQKLDDEILRATTTDALLREDLNDEILRSTNEDTRLSSELSGETARAQYIEGVLSGAIADEEARAISAETALDEKIEAEIDRALDAEDELQDNIDLEEMRAMAEEDALERLINEETARAEDAEQELSGMCNTLNINVNSISGALQSEIARSVSADTRQDQAIADETTRAQGAEAALQNALNNEITRSLSADTVFDSRLDDEILRSTSADTLIQATMATKSDLNNYYTKSESDNKYCTQDYVDGKFSNSYTKPETDALLAAKADKVSAITNAVYDSGNTVINFYNSNNAVVASIDASDFIVDGMVDNVQISGNNLVVTFNVDAGKQDIVVPLTNIFNPTNYYNKSEADSKFATNTNLNTVSGNVNSVSGKVDTLSGKVDTISGVVTAYTADTYTKSDVDAKLSNKQDVSGMSAYTLTSVTNSLSATVTAHTASTTIHVTSTDKSNWNAKQDALVSGTNIKTINNESILGSGNIVITSATPTDAYTKAESDAKFQAISGMSSYTLTSATNSLSGTVTAHTASTDIHVTTGDKATWNAVTAKTDNTAFTAHTADTTVHVTSTEKSNWNAKSDFSGNYNDLTNKPTIPTIWTGSTAQYNALPTKDPTTIYLVSD